MKKRIILIFSLLILVIGVATLILILNKEDAEPKNIQTVNLEESRLSNVSIDNGLILDNSKIECGEEVCIISITAKNTTSSNIDMSGYRMSFIDLNGEEVYWFNGTSIGIVSANSESSFSLEIPNNLKNVNKIVYSKDNI